jgi:flagellar L-ring protein precursor FlgH
MHRHLMCGLTLLLAVIQGAGADSLYKPSTFQPITSDLRPRRPGDLVTVMVYENASATSTADTSAARDASVSLAANAQHTSFNGAIRSSNALDGRGRTQREGRVLAQITVNIVSIGANGDLYVRGEQTLEINNETQRISVEGRIRPQDVSDTNVVLSSRLADARIRYAGQGDLSDKQAPAWWQRFLTWFGV